MSDVNTIVPRKSKGPTIQEKRELERKNKAKKDGENRKKVAKELEELAARDAKMEKIRDEIREMAGVKKGEKKGVKKGGGFIVETPLESEEKARKAVRNFVRASQIHTGKGLKDRAKEIDDSFTSKKTKKEYDRIGEKIEVRDHSNIPESLRYSYEEAEGSSSSEENDDSEDIDIVVSKKRKREPDPIPHSSPTSSSHSDESDVSVRPIKKRQVRIVPPWEVRSPSSPILKPWMEDDDDVVVIHKSGPSMAEKWAHRSTMRDLRTEYGTVVAAYENARDDLRDYKKRFPTEESKKNSALYSAERTRLKGIMLRNRRRHDELAKMIDAGDALYKTYSP